MEKNFFIEFSSPLVKEEKKLLHFLIKRELKLENLIFLLDDLDIPELKNSKLSFINRFTRKGIYLYSDEKIEYLPLFLAYTLKNNFITLKFNPEFIDYLKNEEKIFQFNLPQVLFFKYDFSMDFFYKVIKPNFLNSTLQLTLEDFRVIIQKDKYRRIYDVKRFLIDTLIEDINLFTNFKISYNLIKENKDYSIVFQIKNNQIDEAKNYVQNFLRLYKQYILYPEKLKLIIFNAIQTHGYNYTKKKLLLSIKNKKKYNLKFDDIFEKFLNNELGEFYVNIKQIKCQPKDLDQFRKMVFKEIAPLDVPEIATMDYNTSLSKKIFGLKEKERLEIVSENIKLELFYDTQNESNINISLKYTK